MIAQLMSGHIAVNLVTAVTALLLMASPWLAGFTHDVIASSNAVLCGMLMLAFTAAAVIRLRDWRSWMNLAPGIWVLMSPLILGFTVDDSPAVIHMVVGLIVSVLGLIELCRNESLCLDD